MLPTLQLNKRAIQVTGVGEKLKANAGKTNVRLTLLAEHSG
ncbi:MAG: hypothetical protein RMY64_29265 [Nostoc sp. DedQUE08]|nr:MULTISPECIES: hypothetical protein [unclassified Nostoc]MDZ8069651.1 hypothetical protein [Nostoc sp. DedQUE08]MDZ8135102.1 hypothetical protein [Nostoc sp. DedQUE04]